MDKGEGFRFEVRRCERGFVILQQDCPGAFGRMWAFDTINGAASWLMEQWAEDQAENGQAQ